MSETEVDWPELEQLFGRTEIGVVDLAVSQELAKHENGVRREDFYLVSEGLTYAVLMAMRERGLRFQSVVQAIR